MYKQALRCSLFFDQAFSSRCCTTVFLCPLVLGQNSFLTPPFGDQWESTRYQIEIVMCCSDSQIFQCLGYLILFAECSVTVEVCIWQA